MTSKYLAIVVVMLLFLSTALTSNVVAAQGSTGDLPGHGKILNDGIPEWVKKIPILGPLIEFISETSAAIKEAEGWITDFQQKIVNFLEDFRQTLIFPDFTDGEVWWNSIGDTLSTYMVGIVPLFFLLFLVRLGIFVVTGRGSPNPIRFIIVTAIFVFAMTAMSTLFMALQQGAVAAVNWVEQEVVGAPSWSDYIASFIALFRQSTCLVLVVIFFIFWFVWAPLFGTIRRFFTLIIQRVITAPVMAYAVVTGNQNLMKAWAFWIGQIWIETVTFWVILVVMVRIVMTSVPAYIVFAVPVILMMLGSIPDKVGHLFAQSAVGLALGSNKVILEAGEEGGSRSSSRDGIISTAILSLENLVGQGNREAAEVEQAAEGEDIAVDVDVTADKVNGSPGSASSDRTAETSERNSSEVRQSSDVSRQSKMHERDVGDLDVSSEQGGASASSAGKTQAQADVESSIHSDLTDAESAVNSVKDTERSSEISRESKMHERDVENLEGDLSQTGSASAASVGEVGQNDDVPANLNLAGAERAAGSVGDTERTSEVSRESEMHERDVGDLDVSSEAGGAANRSAEEVGMDKDVPDNLNLADAERAVHSTPAGSTKSGSVSKAVDIEAVKQILINAQEELLDLSAPSMKLLVAKAAAATGLPAAVIVILMGFGVISYKWGKRVYRIAKLDTQRLTGRDIRRLVDALEIK